MLAKLFELDESECIDIFDAKKYIKLLFPFVCEQSFNNDKSSDVNNEIEDINITI